MKRRGNILPLIADRGNLAEAFWRAAGGKRNTAAVHRFQKDLPENLRGLSREILGECAPLGELHRFVIRDPKRRVIHASSFRERVLHHAIMNVVAADFERGAIDQSCACRVGKGNRAALARALRHTTSDRYFLKLDIRRYFDSIGHATLRRGFRRLFKDEALLLLLDRIVELFETTPGHGLPIGALTSQYFANFYLDPMDRFIKENLACRPYVRFMDDFVLWSNDAGRLANWEAEIGEWLRDRLGLQLKEGRRFGRCSEGLPFLGFRLKRGRLLLGKRARARFRRRLRENERAHCAGQLSELDLQRRADALLGFVRQASCAGWRARVVREQGSEAW